jgi:glycine/D-amino acid oxidase-like deaminating enzyme
MRREALTRRDLLRAGGACLALAAAPGLALGSGGGRPGKGRRVVVVGAGAFGGWTALHLLRSGARVTLIDAWGAGNSRASSGGETRVIRATYGPDRIYVGMVARALVLWREHERRRGDRLLRTTGAIWMAGDDDAYERAALPLVREAGLPADRLETAEAVRRWPQVDFGGVRWVIHEKEAGYLLARRACVSVLEAFVAEGGTYRGARVEPGEIAGGLMREVRTSDGGRHAADRFVFACGPWLGRLFPEVPGLSIVPTRQEVYFFGPPAGDGRFRDDRLPVWIDNGPRLFYGIPGNEERGFKIADDARGPEFDPTTGDRVVTSEGVRAARAYLAFRFPALKDAPLLESRVCQYENSADGRFIIDRHPAAENVLLAGGGSGHGFKHGPAVGEMAAGIVLGTRAPEPFFALARFGASDRV